MRWLRRGVGESMTSVWTRSGSAKGMIGAVEMVGGEGTAAAVEEEVAILSGDGPATADGVIAEAAAQETVALLHAAALHLGAAADPVLHRPVGEQTDVLPLPQGVAVLHPQDDAALPLQEIGAGLRLLRAVVGLLRAGTGVRLRVAEGDALLPRAAADVLPPLEVLDVLRLRSAGRDGLLPQGALGDRLLHVEIDTGRHPRAGLVDLVNAPGANARLLGAHLLVLRCMCPGPGLHPGPSRVLHLGAEDPPPDEVHLLLGVVEVPLGAVAAHALRRGVRRGPRLLRCGNGVARVAGV